MKQEKTTMQTKEGLHTQGEWKWQEGEFGQHYIMAGELQLFKSFANTSREERKANAELIVKAVNFYNKLPRLAPDSEVPLPNDEYFLKAVNERKALLDENIELKKQIKDLSDSAIVDMVANNKQALLDSHRELAETLETVYSTLNNWNTARNDGIYSNLLEYIKPKLNNAKNI